MVLRRLDAMPTWFVFAAAWAFVGTNQGIEESSSRATVLSITNLAGSAGEWGGGPALGWAGTRWSVRVALAAGAVALLPAVLLLARSGRRAGPDRAPASSAGEAPVTPGAASHG